MERSGRRAQSKTICIIKNVGNIDLSKRGHTEQEKRQMVEFLNGTKCDFAIAVVVHILLESRGLMKSLSKKDMLITLCLSLEVGKR